MAAKAVQILTVISQVLFMMLTLTVRFVVVCLCKLFVTQQDTALWLRDAFKRRAKPRIRRAHYEI